VHDPDPSYNTPERLLGRDEASTSVQTDITLPETGAGDRAADAMAGGVMLLIAGTLLRRGARRPSGVGR
jgi:LPXTG-motif cell wall-anchored protein